MNTVPRAVLAILLLSVWTTRVGAVDSPFPDIQRILENKKLVVAILAQDAPPMIMTDKKGQLVGHEVDLAEDIGNKLGVKIEFMRTAPTYDGVVELVAQRQADIAVSFLSPSVERAKTVYFTAPYVHQSARIIYNRVAWVELRNKFPFLKRLSEIPESTAEGAIEVGVLKGSVYAASLEREVPGLRTTLYDSFAEIVAKVGSGELFAGYHGEIQIKYYMRLNPETAIDVGMEDKVRDPSDISIAVRPDAPNLLRWLNIYLAEHVGVLDAVGVIEREEQRREEELRNSSAAAD